MSISFLSNSNNLANQLGIYLILANKNKNWSPTVWQRKNRNLAKLTSTRVYMCARIMMVAINVSCRWEGEKGNKE
jgi:hypothetical protein